MAATFSLICDEETLKTLWLLDAEEYPDGNIPFSAFSEWWRQYDLGLRVARDKSQEIIGAVGIWALPEQQIRRFIAGKLREEDLLPTSLATLDAAPSSFWYFSGIFTRMEGAGLNGLLRRLLLYGVGTWAASPHVRFPLYCYALGYSAQGIQLLRRFGFEEIRNAEEMPDGQPLLVRKFTTLDELRGQIGKGGRVEP